jgi:hypothetical protein
MKLATINLSLLAFRVVPTLLAVCLAIPLLLRLRRGIIPADRANTSDIRRLESPRAFWGFMALHLLVFLAIAIWAIVAWCLPTLPPLINDPGMNI